jgi:hypothetical protein
MQMRRLLLGLVLSLALPVSVVYAGNPIPGVGIIVKRNPCCSSAKVVIPGGFFGPGSAPFSGTVAMEGRCSHDCGGCDNNCAGSPTPDGRLDYAADSNAGPFEVTMAAATMYSTTPIEVSINGVPSFFDVFVELSGPGPESDDAITGTMTLAPGSSLDPGTSAPVADVSLDITYKITFHDHTTGDPAGAFLTGDLETILKNLGLLVPLHASPTELPPVRLCSAPTVLRHLRSRLQARTTSSSSRCCHCFRAARLPRSRRRGVR